ncbi:BTB domain-containing protein [Favolaschia claudopus]|uniref:BTB domain-containing protein n=1 Tax=Favolaschia claudopus TaxID=2862362 RepID=A0AAW0BHN1_9AGAR
MSPDNSPPAKRQRVENAPITRSETWMDDGNVVLQAKNIQFRVHWSLLALHSSVFSDMRGLPQPTDQPTVEGCPVVELADDSVDVEYILKALYNPTFLAEEKLPFSAISALLRMGRKYDFRDLFSSAVKRLTSEFPSSFEEYERIESPVHGYTTMQYQAGIEFDIIALAKENNIMTVLPTVCFQVASRIPTPALCEGIQRPDGTIARLSPEYLTRCVAAREKLLRQQFQPGHTFGWARKWPFAPCSTANHCRKLRSSLQDNLIDTVIIGAFGQVSDLEDLKFCRTCREHIAESMAEGRKKMWELLPGFFNLPSWNELKNDV